MPVILSIQSHVAFGHVGNSAAVFPMQRLGVEVLPVHTVQFSNHPGYGAFRGRVFEAEMIGEVVAGIDERGALATCDAVLSGYMGSAETAGAILDAVSRVKAANPAAIYACDPVIGDAGPGIYVRQELAAFIRDQVVRNADILTPNLFELGYLAGATIASLGDLRSAVAVLHAAGPRVVLITSVELDETPPGMLDMIVSDGARLHRLRTPKLAASVNGAGDTIAALFLVHFLSTRDVGEALGRAGASVYGLIARTLAAGSRELLTIAAQDEFVQPSRTFKVEPL